MTKILGVPPPPPIDKTFSPRIWTNLKNDPDNVKNRGIPRIRGILTCLCIGRYTLEITDGHGWSNYIGPKRDNPQVCLSRPVFTPFTLKVAWSGISLITDCSRPTNMSVNNFCSLLFKEFSYKSVDNVDEILKWGVHVCSGYQVRLQGRAYKGRPP